MAYSAPTSRATGFLVTAAVWNQDVVDNVAWLAGMTHGGTTLGALSSQVEIGWTVGDLKCALAESNESNRWLLCAGGTIGSASSGGTVRANSDMETLFTHIWTVTTNTEFVIQDSGGSPTTRGASAAADFSANKRMPLPDLRGRALVGLDDMGGTSANVNTDAAGDILGDVEGSETHTLATSEIPAHNHTMRYMSTGSGGTTSQPDSVLQYNATPLNYSMTTADAGGGGAHTSMQPYMSIGILIYTGN